MIACRPVEWPEQEPFNQYEPTPIYPGSVVGSCMDCEGPIYIGPKQQAHLEQFPDWPIVCFVCLPKHADPNAYVHDLGNTHLPE